MHDIYLSIEDLSYSYPQVSFQSEERFLSITQLIPSLSASLCLDTNLQSRYHAYPVNYERQRKIMVFDSSTCFLIGSSNQTEHFTSADISLHVIGPTPRI